LFFLSSYDHFQRKLIIIAKSQGFFPWLFSLSWEQRKVGELIEDYIEKTIIQNQYPVLTSSQQQGIVFQEDYFADRQVTTNDNIGYYVLPYGYFTYRSRSDTDVFVFNRNSLIDKGIISYYYPVFSAKGCDSNFLLRRLNHGIKKQLSMAAEGTGQKVLAHNKFKNMVVDVPSISEQVLIGQLFERLDNLITLHQHEPLFLVMLFSGGSCVFKSAWEQRKLETAFDFSVSNNTLSRAELNYEDGEVKSVHYGDVLIKYGSVLDAQVDEIPFITGKKGMDFLGQWLQEGDIIIADTAEDETTGKATEIRHLGAIPVVSGLHTIVCRPTAKMAPYYLGSYLNSDSYHRQLLPLMQGIKVLSLSRSNLIKTEIKYPKSQEEQKQIGCFFRSLDDLITLHQRERLLMKGNRSTEAGEGTHNQINVLILQLLNNMEISLLRCCHACMA